MVGIHLQDWPYIETTLGKCDLISKSIIYRLDTLPTFQPESIGYQSTCNAFTRHSNDMTI